MAGKFGRVSCLKDYRMRGTCACAFGLGLALSCFCPQGLILFLAAVIITALGIALLCL